MKKAAHRMMSGIAARGCAGMAKAAELRSLEFYVNSELWDEGGALTAAHMRFFVDDSGIARRIDYAAPEAVRDVRVNLGEKWAKKFLGYAAGVLLASSWAGTLLDAGENVVAFPGTKPLSEDASGDFAGWDLYRKKGQGPEPLWALRLTAKDGGGQETAFHHRMHDEPQALFWALMELFEPDGEWLEDDSE